MQLSISDLTAGKQVGNIDVPDAAFAVNFNEALVHQVVTAYLAKARAGTHAQKTRAEVRGGGIKPWKQKGTGRARAGTIRSPLWRKGGVVFAAKPRDYSQKVNKKMHRAALRSIISELVRQERLHVYQDFKVSKPKTKELVGVMDKLGFDNLLIVIDEENRDLQLAARNLHTVHVMNVNELSPVSLIRFENVLFTVSAVKKLEELLA